MTLDAIGIGLMFPILPELMRQLDGTDEITVRYGAMMSVFAVMQLLFAPLLGAASDRFGRRPVLVLSLLGGAVDYALMAVAPALWMLFVGRAIAGVSAANVAVATAVIADVTPEGERAGRFGWLHACFGLGFVVGPLLGGVLGAWNLRAPFVAAAILCTINLVFALLMLPETRKGSDTSRSEITLNPLAQLRWGLSLRGLRAPLGLYAVVNLVAQVYGTTWVLFCEDRFGWGAMMVGLSLTVYGLLHAGAQAGLTGPVTRRFGERATVMLGIVGESLACVALAMAGQGWMLFALLPLFVLSGLSVPALQAILSAEVGEEHQGRLQGVLSSVVSLATVVGPLLFSLVYARSRGSWDGAAWVVAVGLYALAAPLVWWALRRRDTQVSRRDPVS